MNTMKSIIITIISLGFVILPAALSGVLAGENASSDKILTQANDKTVEITKPISFEQRKRRDPFQPAMSLKDKKTGPSVGVVDTSSAKKLVSNSLEEAVARLRQAQQCLDRMERITVEFPVTERDKALVEPYQNILEYYEILSKTNYESIKTQIENIRQKAERLFPGAERVYSQATYLREQAAQNFTAGEFNRLGDNLKEISVLPDRVEIKGTKYKAEIQKMAEDVQILNQRGIIIREFYSKSLEINGIIYYTRTEEVVISQVPLRFLGLDFNTPLTYRRVIPASSAIINNSFYEEGAYIEKELSIKKIEPEIIWFLYKGEEVKKSLGKK
jgi:hypothetical protein